MMWVSYRAMLLDVKMLYRCCRMQCGHIGRRKFARQHNLYWYYILYNIQRSLSPSTPFDCPLYQFHGVHSKVHVQYNNDTDFSSSNYMFPWSCPYPTKILAPSHSICNGTISHSKVDLHDDMLHSVWCYLFFCRLGYTWVYIWCIGLKSEVRLMRLIL